jgi:hypothetical protein
MVMIVSAKRSLAEHQKNLANGRSWIALSLHLPRALRIPNLSTSHPDYQASDAIDLCPYEEFLAHGPDKLAWNAADPAWRIIGEVGEAAGLTGGGRWKSVPGKSEPDLGHLELPRHLIR